VLDVVLNKLAVDGIQAVPFHVWVMLDAVFQNALTGFPVQD